MNEFVAVESWPGLFDERTDPLLLLLCSWTQVKQLEKGKVYAQGSMQRLSEITGKETRKCRMSINAPRLWWDDEEKVCSHMSVYTHIYTGWTGSKVLYFGDSLWADLVDARRLKGWRTVRAHACMGHVWRRSKDSYMFP